MDGWEKKYAEELKELENCNMCPRECGVNRLKGAGGYCRTGSGFYISSIIIHKGEEPVISGKDGICNVFFSHCNLQCTYCQNYQISGNRNVRAGRNMTLNEVIRSITSILDSGIENVGFVSPSHMVPQMKIIIKALNEEGYYPVIVYNTNGYDRAETIRSLEKLVDVYLPDLKYNDPGLAGGWSDAADYPAVAQLAVKEMYRQKGNVLHLNEKGKLTRGMIVRHLVLPGSVKNSIEILKFLADEISNRIAISLMSQYNPIANVKDTIPLNRKILESEYAMVVEHFNKLGFTKGWIQELQSAECYNPDFNSASPFDK